MSVSRSLNRTQDRHTSHTHERMSTYQEIPQPHTTLDRHEHVITRAQTMIGNRITRTMCHAACPTTCTPQHAPAGLIDCDGACIKRRAACLLLGRRSAQDGDQLPPCRREETKSLYRLSSNSSIGVRKGVGPSRDPPFNRRGCRRSTQQEPGNACHHGGGDR